MDDDIYSHHTYHPMAEYSDKAMMSPDNFMLCNSDYSSLMSSSGVRDNRINMASMFGSDELLSAASAMSEPVTITPELHGDICGVGGGRRDEDVLSVTKAKIATHPSYPRLLKAYVECQKVGAPPQISNLLDDIRSKNEIYPGNSVSTCVGADPDLDEFMESYCDMLVKYKSDLARSFDEAANFLNGMEMQLTNLCQGSSIRGHSGEGAVSSDEEFREEEIEEPEAQQSNVDRDLKKKLIHKFGSHITSLKLEFSKKKKKGKLPTEARQTLLDWWNIHYKWPYPTEADKIALAETTGLDPRQINNWFINQRKRHWI